MNEQVEQDQRTILPGRKWSYQWLVDNSRFFLFLALLAVVYIYNAHYAEKTIKNINRTARELKELQYEYKTVKGELMMKSRQTEIARMVAGQGLKELKYPPFRVVDSSGQ